ncbi:sensor histidine kinase [Tepidibacter thalassicus]|uniref:histidine kinase n=1 Tax=Tepidibacter thalassicus DSM 15285 TaxID=1123350 RepID=A0A1M5SEF6_9FIRM|nr:HAMP domain-containing sensor histidine kinase [Tepidibacter thalassicus]SHH36861.1 HAMP domain-containing protein [Tepidibacter thalassicus DSM 15285]
MFEKYSLKKQFILTFILILISSILSMVFISVIAFFILSSPWIYPANYYEKQMPRIEKYVKENNTKLLDVSFKKNLEKIIPLSGIEYKVVNFKTDTNYGNLEYSICEKNDLIDKINTSILNKNEVLKFIPIIDDKFNINGVIIFKYILKVQPISKYKTIFFLGSIVYLISPFLFIIIYSIIFGKKFSKNINIPLKQLIDASNKIKNYDLDFKLNYSYNNELGKLIQAFESMRCELKETLTKQWVAEKEKRDIVSSLSHDLRTPLTIIKGHVEMLKEGFYKDERRLKKYLDIIETSTNRAVLLVEDLNVLSKFENPKFKLNIRKTNVLDFIKEKLEEYKLLAEKNGILLSIITENIDNNTIFYMDKLRICQVIDNILINSFRYTNNKDSICIKISLVKNKLKFIISDTGKGFSEEDLKYAFRKFYKGDKSRSKDIGSYGLGLYIAKTIVEKHGGKIRIYNDKGATVEFFIVMREKL